MHCPAVINTRIHHLRPYPFERLRDLLADLTPGMDPIHVHLGEPQHPVPAVVAPCLAQHAGDWGRYPPVQGTEAFRIAVAEWLRQRYALPDLMINPGTMILPASGTREALYMIHQVLPAPSPDVSYAVMSDPFYQVYYAGAAMGGFQPFLVPAEEGVNLFESLASIPADILQKTSVLTVCSPSNPQGSVATVEQWKALIQKARAHNIFLLADECYSEIYTMDPPPGVLEACRELGGSLDQVIVFNSLSKRSNVPGLRSGFICGDPRIMAALTRLRSYACAGMPLPIAEASVALWSDEVHVRDNRRLYSEKFDDASVLLKDQFAFSLPSGGFFLWLDVGDGIKATRQLWQNAGVSVLPGRFLASCSDSDSEKSCADRFIRVALVHTRAAMREALERLITVLR